MTNSLGKHPNERAMYELLGQMVSMAAHLEMRLQMLATTLVETPYAAHWIHGENASKVIKLIGDVAKEHPAVSAERYVEVKAILKECTRLFDRRHGYVHGAWSVDGSEPEGTQAWQTMRFARGKQAPTFAPLSLEDLADLIHGFDNVLSEVMAWMIEHINPSTSAPDPDPSITDA
ncbi:hypothetical protein KVH22_22165 [Streptomyces olivaceus]|uniref:hypothetical protein n=1 Tax=Streptomyces olivaceus TaxID=47716 RepID=UPI0018A8299E|nr:hypothetical protein [Streptomyces olivaceus]MBF8174103.1 hypothetical protein [Streptomyces olivaceus]MBZ6258226.1 hypothetical protein [Streptomyces olivaceus]